MPLILPEMCQARLCPGETVHKLVSARCGRTAPEESKGAARSTTQTRTAAIWFPDAGARRSLLSAPGAPLAN
jgi:hypothetical protein